MEPAAPKVELRFVSRPDQLCRVRTVVRAAVRRQGFTSEIGNGIVLAVDEACANIIRHAYGPSSTGEIILEIWTDNDEIVFRLTDFADPVDPRSVCSRDLSDIRPGGLGVHLIHAIMDKVEFLEPPESIGNILEMRKKLQCR